MRPAGRRAVLVAAGLLLGCGCLVAAAAALSVPLLFWARAPSGTPPTAVPPPGTGRTVLLIAVDDLRRDHLAFHGYPHDPTPALTALARRGVVAEDFVPASTATGPSLAALLSGRGPAETGFASARELGAHRLPAAVSTLAEELRAAGWRTAGALALPQDAGRLSGLAQGLDDVLAAPPAGPPLAAADAVAGLVAIARAHRREADLFAVLHLADLRADGEPAVDAARLGAWLERHLAPFRGDAELAAALDRLDAAPAEGAARIDALVGRRRGSAAWLALQSARYDARLDALDAGLDELLRGLAAAGRPDPLVVVAGTRGRLLGVEPPADGPPAALSEALLATALVVAGPGEDGAALERWRTVDRGQRVCGVLRAELLGRAAPLAEEPGLARDGLRPGTDAARATAGGPGTGDDEPRLVAAPGFAAIARVGRAQKDVLAAASAQRSFTDTQRSFDRATDLPADALEPTSLADAAADVASAWELTVADDLPGELHLRFGAQEHGIRDAFGAAAKEALATSTGRSADLRFGGAAVATVVTRAATTPLVLQVSCPGVELAVAAPERAAPAPLVSALPPVFPARAADDAAPARLALAREGGWTRVTLAGGGDTAVLALWLHPPGAGPLEPAVERVRGVDSAVAFPGLGAARVEGTAPLELRIEIAPGQRLAVAAEVAGVPLSAAAMASDRGGDPAVLELYLPPVDLRAFDVFAGGARVLRAERRRPGAPLAPPYGLSAADARLLLRLGPLE